MTNGEDNDAGHSSRDTYGRARDKRNAGTKPDASRTQPVELGATTSHDTEDEVGMACGHITNDTARGVKRIGDEMGGERQRPPKVGIRTRDQL